MEETKQEPVKQATKPSFNDFVKHIQQRVVAEQIDSAPIEGAFNKGYAIGKVWSETMLSMNSEEEREAFGEGYKSGLTVGACATLQ